MVLELLSVNFTAFLSLPWINIIIGVIIAHFIGWFWYGTLFNKQYMAVTGNKETKSNWVAVGVSFLGTLALGYLIGVLSLLDDLALIGIDALLAVIIAMIFASALFRFDNSQKATRFWLITAGNDIISVLVISAIVFFF